jgi:leucyl/phenylalanyl-tRNA--protein transferase
MISYLRGSASFPPVESALHHPNGLLAAGGDLSPRRLLEAYRRGIFPWYTEGEPILWWSPTPRMVLFTHELHVSRSLRRRLNSRRFDVRADTAFRQVMEACAGPRRGQIGTWITSAMIDGYCALHALGHAHCVECWLDGALAGGVYGVQIGRMFFGESMFHFTTDASKVALVNLVQRLGRMGVPLMDCQQETAHTAAMGGRPIPRQEFSSWIERLVDSPPLLSFHDAGD